MPREFEIRREVELAATPEQVWEAIATGPGNAAWLFPTEVEPREGGKSADGSTVTVWDPPRHFAVRAEGEGGWFNALEAIIEGREGGSTVLRYVHSGIFVDDWDNQYDSADRHTDFYLHTLGQYLRYFSGRAATYVGAQGPPASARPEAFTTLRRALGLGDQAADGDRVRLRLPGLEPLDGVLDYLAPQFIGIRTADGLYRFFGRNAWGMPIGLGHHLFAEGVDQGRTEQAWRAWLDSALAAQA
jgi:hypothetical protein